MFVGEIIKIPVSASAGMACKGEAQCDPVVNVVAYLVQHASRCQSSIVHTHQVFRQSDLIVLFSVHAVKLLAVAIV